MESLTGDAGEADPSVEPVAGMSLDMMGVSLRPVEFFRGSGGLMSAVWSAPSELTTALQVSVHDVSIIVISTAWFYSMPQGGSTAH